MRPLCLFAAALGILGAMLVLYPLAFGSPLPAVGWWFGIEATTAVLACFMFVFAVTGWALWRHYRRGLVTVAIFVIALLAWLIAIEEWVPGVARAATGMITVAGTLGFAIAASFFLIRTWPIPDRSRIAWRVAGIAYALAGTLCLLAFAAFVLDRFGIVSAPPVDEIRPSRRGDWLLGVLAWNLGGVAACLAMIPHSVALVQMCTAHHPPPARGFG